MHSELEHLKRLSADPQALAPRPMRGLRAVLAVKALLLVVLMALAHEHPEVMLVGLAPLALLAAELAWHLPDGIGPRDGGR
jgi:hypothetical protein